MESDIRRTQDFSLNVSTVELCESSWLKNLTFLFTEINLQIFHWFDCKESK